MPGWKTSWGLVWAYRLGSSTDIKKKKKKKQTNTDRRVAEMKKKLIKEMKGLKTNLLFFNEKQKDLTMLYHQESVLKVIARILHHYTTRSF